MQQLASVLRAHSMGLAARESSDCRCNSIATATVAGNFSDVLGLSRVPLK